ncbi:MAG: hypothetical protein LBD76_08450 [Prevotellaceae bacterium]|jgi:hypothetical protein|nr:hypothetical protein [Prevotellaceae bacterium]
MKLLKRILMTAGGDDDSLIIFVWKHYKYIMLIFVLMILYISNGLIHDLEIKRQNQLKEDLLRAKVRYNTKLREFMETGSYRKLLELSDKYGLELEAPDTPPIKIEK